MKKLLALALALVMMLGCIGMTACSDETDGDQLKVGVILIGDENEGYTYAHISGIKKAVENLGGSDKVEVIWKYNVKEDQTCFDQAEYLVSEGCDVIFSNSYGHQSYILEAAKKYPEVQFVAVTGDTAASQNLSNFSNAFNKTYESRFVSGVVAGMKIKELVEQNKLTDANYDADGNVKVGYVGAFPYAEVVSGYTAYFLGIRSVYEKVAMTVQYTDSWFSLTGEAAAAQQLAAQGCVIICQHADSTGAPSEVQSHKDGGQVIYSVGYNIDMLAVAPTAALTSATNDWSKYYTYAIDTVMKGEKIATNWSAGYSEDAVGITALGPECAAGTAEKVAEVEAALKAGTLKVFDVTTFTVTKTETSNTGATVDANGHLTAYLADINADFVGETNVIADGCFQESDATQYRSAPYFDVRIDGITEITK